MRGVALARSLAVMLLPCWAGCAGNPYALQQQNQTLQQAQVALTQRNTELQARTTTLDQDNQELEAMLARTRQESKLMEDQLAAVREQLTTATSQLAQTRDAHHLAERQTEALMASQRKIGASINPNNSLQQTLPAINLPGVEARADGDVIRIELPASRLFQGNAVTLNPSAGVLIDSVMAEVSRTYPDHIIGIEGHTDNSLPAGAAPGSAQQVSVGRAMALYQYLTTRTQIPPARLFIVGHGGNHPVVSNATPAGQARNNRVEIVIYPDRPNANS